MPDLCLHIWEDSSPEINTMCYTVIKVLTRRVQRPWNGGKQPSGCGEKWQLSRECPVQGGRRVCALRSVSGLPGTLGEGSMHCGGLVKWGESVIISRGNSVIRLILGH